MKIDSERYTDYLYAKASAMKKPLSASVEITSRCNFDCKMCYIHRSNCDEVKSSELSTDEWKRIADEMKKEGVLFVLFTGGEPLIREDFKELYIYYKRCGFQVSVNTNASMIDDGMVEFFREYPPYRLNISVYGMSDETYEKVTGRKEMYKKVTDAVLKLKNEGIAVKLNYTVSGYNSCDIHPMYEWTKANDLPVQAACYMFPAVRSDGRIDRPTAEETAKNIIECEKARLPKDAVKEYFTNKLKGITPDLSGEPVDDIGERLRCRAGKCTFWITYTGDMTPCGMMPEPKVSLKEKSFSEAWDIIVSEAEKIFLPPECKNCSYKSMCEVCAAVCYAETGSFSKKSDYLCKKTEECYRLAKEEIENENQ